MGIKCLIIAAGCGRRLRQKGDSKPLIPILGIPLIERVIRTAMEAGVDEFYVVIGWQSGRVRDFLEGLAKRLAIRITPLVNEDWEKENGLSVLKARDVLQEPFLLLMADNLFDPELVRALTTHSLPDGEVALVVDSNIHNPLINMDDVTRVRVKNGKICDIGKGMTDFNGFDTGIFLCSSAIFEWIDVDDPAAFKRAEKALLDRLRGKPTDGPVSRYLNRPLSVMFSRHLVKLNITPNQISLFSFLCSLVAAGLFMMGGYIFLLIGGILAQFASIIEGCDGEVARLKYQSSDFGGWFDAVLDRYADAFLLFGLTWHLLAREANGWVLFIGFMAIIGSFMLSYTADKYDNLMRERIKAGGGAGLRMGRDVRVFLIFLGAVTNMVLPVLVVIAVVMNVEIMRRVRVASVD